MTNEETSRVVDLEISEREYREIEAWIFREARLADESQYEEWEALWDEDGTYWVPAGEVQDDSRPQVSIIDDNRARLASRVRQLQTGQRLAQVPVSIMRRQVTNLEIARLGSSEYEAVGNFLLVELPVQTTRKQRLWGGQVRYHIRTSGEGLKMFHKRVLLVDRSEPIPNLSFLI